MTPQERFSDLSKAEYLDGPNAALEILQRFDMGPCKDSPRKVVRENRTVVYRTTPPFDEGLPFITTHSDFRCIEVWPGAPMYIERLHAGGLPHHEKEWP